MNSVRRHFTSVLHTLASNSRCLSKAELPNNHAAGADHLTHKSSLNFSNSLLVSGLVTTSAILSCLACVYRIVFQMFTD
jgi:hypothetical protein